MTHSWLVGVQGGSDGTGVEAEVVVVLGLMESDDTGVGGR